MSNLQDEQAQIELETVEMQHWVTMGEDLKFLKENPQFQRVIMNGYLRDKALDSVSMLADPGVLRRGERPAVMEDLVAGSNLQYFFSMIEGMYAGALNELSGESDDDLDESEELS